MAEGELTLGQIKSDATPVQMLRQTNIVSAIQSAAYTASPMETVLVDCASAGGDIPVNLPSPVNVGDYVRVVLLNTSNNRICTIGRNGNPVRSGTDTSFWSLMIPGDSVLFHYASEAVGWIATTSMIKAHVCRQSSSAQTTLPADTATQVNLGAVNIDDGGCANASNNRIIVRRAGNYTVVGAVSIAALGVNSRLSVNIRVNNIEAAGANAASVPSSGSTMVTCTRVLSLLVGDVVTLWATWQNTPNIGSKLTDVSNASVRPTLSIVEER